MNTKIRILFLGLVLLGNYLFGQSLQSQLASYITYVVAQDGSGQYTTVQAAINAIPNNSTTQKVIFVKKGKYPEKVEIPSSKTNLTIVGEDVSNTIISFNDYSGSGKIYNGLISSANGVAIGTSTSHTLYTQASDFALMNITIENTAGDVGQAVALNTHGDRQFLYHCRLIGYQDTYYTWSDGRVYALDNYIEGAVDYIFGRGVALFENCVVHSVRSSSYITAASTDQNFKFGYVFKNCKLTGKSGITSVYLGRPWKAYGQTVFMNSDEGSFLNTAGWSIWNGNTNHTTCYYGEYKNCGSGSATGSRASWSHQLTDIEAGKYTISTLFDKTTKPAGYAASWLPVPSNNPVFNIVDKNTDAFIQSACFAIPTGVEEVALEQANSATKVFPNPFEESFTIQADGNYAYAIMDVSGWVIEQGSLPQKSTLGGNLPQGLYLVCLKGPKGQQLFKVQKR